MRPTIFLERLSVITRAIGAAIGLVTLAVATPGIARDGDPPAPGAQAPDATAVRARYDRIHDDLEASGHHCLISAVDRAAALAAIRAFAKDTLFLQITVGQPIRVTLPQDYYNPQGRTVTFDSIEFAVNRADLNKPYIAMTRTASGLKLEPTFVVTFDPKLTVCSRILSIEVPNGYRTEGPAKIADPAPTR